MPTVLTHAVLATTLTPLAPAGFSRARVAFALAVVSVFPDLDVVAFRLGIPYEHPLGHRGISHSLAFAMLLAVLVTRFGFRSLAPRPPEWWRLCLLLFVATASHGLLDALTNGGRGVGLLLPFTGERYFAPMRPIPVSPIGLHPSVLGVLAAEIALLWLPSLAVLGVALLSRRFRSAEG